MTEENKTTERVEPIQVAMGVDGEETYDEFDNNQKLMLRCYHFTSIIGNAMSKALLGETIESISLGFVPPEHPMRKTFDLGWRVLVYMEENDQVLVLDPTAAYARAFLSDGTPDDIKWKGIFKEINDRHESGEISVLKVPKETVEESE